MPTFAHFSHDAFVAGVRTLAARIGEDGWQPSLLVGVGRGGLVPAVFLSHATGLAMVSIDFSTPISEFNAPLVDALAARTRHDERLLFVEDINDSGRTIEALRRQLDDAGAVRKNARFAVLLDNVVSTQKVDYRSAAIDRTVTKDWFVFPWEAMASEKALLHDAGAVPERIA